MLKALLKTLTEEKIQQDPAGIYRKIKRESIRQLVIDLNLPEPEFSQRYHEYEAAVITESFPFSDTRTTLEKIQANGGRHFILTHRTTASTWEMLKRDQLAEEITEVIGSDCDFPRKPDPSAINFLVSKYQLNKTETIMVGDRPLDIEAGKRAGVKTCFYDIDHFIEVSADFTVNKLAEIVSII